MDKGVKGPGKHYHHFKIIAKDWHRSFLILGISLFAISNSGLISILFLAEQMWR
jgi:hypothetical protein